MIEVDQPEVRRQRVQRAVRLQVDTQPAVQDQRRRSVAELFDVQAYAVDVDQRHDAPPERGGALRLITRSPSRRPVRIPSGAVVQASAQTLTGAR